MIVTNRVRVLVNILGSALTFYSLTLPWISFSNGVTFSSVQAADTSLPFNASMAISLVVAGAIISLLSRYGGFLTMTGVGLFVARPPGPMFFPANGVILTSSLETGVWLALGGAAVSFLGGSWTLPFGLESRSERKMLTMSLFPAAVVVLIFGLLLINPILSLLGLVLAGASFMIILSRGKEPVTQ